MQSDLDNGGLVVMLILVSILVAVGTGLISGGRARVIVLAAISGFIGAFTAIHYWMKPGDPEAQLGSIVVGFVFGVVPGILLAVAINRHATARGRSSVSPITRTAIQAITAIAAGIVVGNFVGWWDVTHLA